jgi:hypothetical protein
VANSTNPVGEIRKLNIGIPYKGLDLEHSVSVLDVDSALDLVNFMPPTDSLEVRKGFTLWVQSQIDDKDDLFVCNLPNAKCFFLPDAQSGQISQIKLDGSVKVFDVASSSGNYSSCTFGNFFYFGDGDGDLISFDGNGFSSRNFYEVDNDAQTPITDVDNPVSFANRLFFTKGLMVYYGKPMELEGEAEEIDLSFYLSRGGAIVKAFTFSTNYNDNIMSHLCFLSSEGQLITFVGTDPSDENKWNLGGIFDVPNPVNKKCFAENVEGDVLIFAKGGIRSLRKIILGEKNDFTQNLESGLGSVLKNINYGEVTNLFFLKYIKSKKLVVLGIPTGNELDTIQYVFGLDKGTWSSFNNLNIVTLAQIDETICGATLYSGPLLKLFDGFKDNDQPVKASYAQGFSSLSTGNEKFLRKAEIFTTAADDVKFSYSLDFSTRNSVSPSAFDWQGHFLRAGRNIIPAVIKSIFYTNENPARKISFGAEITTSQNETTKVYETYIEFFESIN